MELVTSFVIKNNIFYTAVIISLT